MHIESTSQTHPFCSLFGQKQGFKDKFCMNNNIKSPVNDLIRPTAKNQEIFSCKCFNPRPANNEENPLLVRSSTGIDYLIADFRKSIPNTLNNPSNGIQVKNRLPSLKTVPQSDFRPTDSPKQIPSENTIKRCENKKDIYRISNGVEESKDIKFTASHKTEQQVDFIDNLGLCTS